ncbi:MAG: hypothetical protein K2N94_12045, partial [Lachnospiraceae bacterium]|nr:hypothetical protein [Lachnospiraceae bacterium]
MSEINSFSDYTNKYNTRADLSALFGSTSDTEPAESSNPLTDFAALRNGSYKKLLKAYYAKQDAEKLSGAGDSPQKSQLIRTSADALKKAADALNSDSLWEKKKIRKKDENGGDEIELEDYDRDAITKAVKDFVDAYNDMVEEA